MPKRSLLRLAGAMASAMNFGCFTLRLAEELTHLRQQLDEIERLGQVPIRERAELDGPRRRILVRVDRAHQEDRRIRPATFDLAHQLEAVLARKLDIDEAEVRRRLVELLDAFGPRARRHR